MKTVVFLFLSVLFLSCVDDVNNVEEQFPQQWNLVRMTTPDGSADKAGIHLDWQEFYIFKSDGTFLKSRLQDGVRASANGTFTRNETEDETLLILTFDEESAIIGSCDPDPKETLIVLGSSVLISAWPACDGPGLEYFRVQ